jgi:hypothetical protein
LLAKK